MTPGVSPLTNYRPRHAESKLRSLADFFKVVLVVGARQVGKSTLLAHVFPEYQSVVFDPIQDLYGARQDPDLFLNNFRPPLILDEIQYAPELLPALKRRVDGMGDPGQYLLTGSQNLAVLRTVAESMAGRVGILPLQGLTSEEIQGRGEERGWLADYLEAPDSLLDLEKDRRSPISSPAHRLWRGMMPGLLDAPDSIVPDFFRSYVQTYVDRDIRSMEDIRQLAEFGRFLSLAAALTSQEVNTSQLGREVGVSPSTARRWLDLLSHTYQWRQLPPYHGNTIKRLTGKSKGYLADTGLASYLQRLSSPQALAVSPLLGALFESFVVQDIHGQFVQLQTPPLAHHWRSAGGAEVDLVLERDGRLHPIEIKCKTQLSGHDTRGLRAFRETYPGQDIATGLIVYAGDRCYRCNEDTIALPWDASRG